MMRKVLRYERMFNKNQNWRIGAHTKKLILECGHFNFRKGNVPVPKRARCRECDTASQLEEVESQRDRERMWKVK